MTTHSAAHPAVQAEVLPRDAGGGHPTAATPPAPTAPSPAAPAADARPGTGLAAPGLIVLATVAILEGYRWLDLMRLASPRPTMVAYVVLVVPAAFVLTRTRRTGRSGPAARLAVRAGAVAVVVLGIVALVTDGTRAERLLGVASLGVAGACLVLVWSTERRRR